jgi:hypothetical protein
MTQAADRYLFAVQVLKDRYLCVRSVDLAHYLASWVKSLNISFQASGRSILCFPGDIMKEFCKNENFKFFLRKGGYYLLMDQGSCRKELIRK